jgi:hypothetical protein
MMLQLKATSYLNATLDQEGPAQALLVLQVGCPCRQLFWNRVEVRFALLQCLAVTYVSLMLLRLLARARWTACCAGRLARLMRSRR